MRRYALDRSTYHGVSVCGVELPLRDLSLLLLGDLLSLGLAYQLHLLEHLLISGVHLKICLKLCYGDRFSVTMGDHIIEGEDQVKGFLHYRLFIERTLLALLDHDLVELPNDLQVLNDIRILIRNQNQVELLYGEVHIPDALSFNVSALLAYKNKE